MSRVPGLTQSWFHWSGVQRAQACRADQIAARRQDGAKRGSVEANGIFAGFALHPAEQKGGRRDAKLPGLPVGEYKIEVPADVPVDAFWSISAYNAKGFFEKNSLGAYNINSVTGKQNDDGSMTVHLGGCKNERVNCLPIVEGWNYTVRLYQPRTEVLDGSWTFPEARPVR